MSTKKKMKVTTLILSLAFSSIFLLADINFVNAETNDDVSLSESDIVPFSDLLSKYDEFIASQDPTVAKIIDGALVVIKDIVGVDVLGFLGGENDLNVVIPINLGDVIDELGIDLDLEIEVNVHYDIAENRLEFLLALDTILGLDINDMAIGGSLIAVSDLIDDILNAGVEINVEISTEIEIAWYINIEDSSCGIYSVAVGLNPVLTCEAQIIPIIIQYAAPEIKPVLDIVNTVLEKYLDIAFYSIAEAIFVMEIDLWIICNADTGEYTIDCLFMPRLNMELNLFGVDTKDLIAGLVGTLRISYDSDGVLTYDGSVSFELTINTDDLFWILEAIVIDLLEDADLKANEVNSFPLFEY